MHLIIGGDLVPTKSNIDLFVNENIKSLLGEELFSLWNSAEIRIFNLEAPLIDKENPIAKMGPNLIAPTSTIKGIKALNPSLVTLANNHILDQGIEGLNSTENLLSEYNIPYTGVGDNLTQSSKPYILERDGISIGIYTCAENEFTIATDKTPGANPFDPLESLDHIQKLKSRCDYVIVLYHGGKEYYRYPSPYLQKVCRKIAEKGADVVICQHSHCVGSYENYQDSTIVYGQGNFIFDNSDSEFWQTSILVNIEITDQLVMKYIPIVKKDNVIRLADDKQSENILTKFYKNSKDIRNEGFVENQYQKFANEKMEGYLRTFSGFGKWLSRIDRRILSGVILRKRYSESKLLAIQNFVECEAHRELMLQGLKGEIKSGR